MKPLYSCKKEMYPFKNFVKPWCLVSLICIAFSSCKKEYIDYPYAEIINFSIIDANGAVLKAAVDNNEIIIYWPPEQAVPETVTPTVIVSERANVQPASNTPIAFIDGTSFTVTAEDGTAKVYKLKRIINVPKPYVTDFSGITSYNDKNFILVGDQLSFAGDYFNTTEGQLKVFFLTADGREVEVPISNSTSLNIWAIPDEMTVGTYTSIRLESAPYTITVERDFEVIEDPRPSNIPLNEAITLKRGEEYKLAGKNLDKVTQLLLNNQNSRTYIPVEIVNVSSDEITLRIPVDFPLNTYHSVRFIYASTPYFSDTINTLSLNNTLTVTE
ncbi:MAG: hypothetical protein M5Z89_00810 [Olivibacter sp.]|uniref:hypothetical protein n=1 Tax=Olivibacter sp. 47 TaxID=3056486 RepID=UPI0025A3E124|nr:hypothetical protein [Olivibacter sp. 47]MCL4637502.1 hypothetical protein [Olivibacter sp. UJ_SKK_5.1]MDM8175434.1 hypothetical protein [Olivibacter sp. 47]